MRYLNKIKHANMLYFTKYAEEKSQTLNKATRSERWEKIIDFTKIKKGGIDIDEILSKIRNS